ncbi:MAG: radical SAM family heme chaperone HemW [Erysipelotrichaceae bacterium]|nr:radical SAM family heme chaperone HemW [Erysipelotrichaceae bacterium]MDD4642463.1 radical SAM family heme chaperone HemW [Erysipelotrichaceae bacterium]
MISSLYVHIPFCKSICAYCDFCRVGYDQNLVDQYLVALQQELSQRVDHQNLKTIYIGGGTPTALSDEQFQRLLMILQPYTKDVKEYTIEINPETLTKTKLNLLSTYGINRVSLGVQTLNDRLLKIIKRQHTTEQVIHAIDDLLACGIDNISVDVMFGLPTQSLTDLIETLTSLITWPIKHISLYDLTIEEHSYFGRHHIKKADDELCDQMYFSAIALLEKAGFRQYEISNFAKSGYQSQHNIVYWQYQDFYGVGLNASSKIGHYRYTNTSNFVEYLANRYINDQIYNDKRDYLFERMMMGLRIKEGIVLSKIEENDILCIYKEELADLINRKLLVLVDHRLKATTKGYSILNDILVDLLPK